LSFPENRPIDRPPQLFLSSHYDPTVYQKWVFSRSSPLIIVPTANFLPKLADKPNRMNVSYHTTNDVIETYTKNMKRLSWSGWGKHIVPEDSVSISEEGIKKVLAESIEENVSGAEATQHY